MTNAVKSQEAADPYLWLENVDGADAIAWAKKQNEIAEAELQAGDVFKSLYPSLKKVLDSSDRIPLVEKHGRWLYNFWRDAKHPRGIWRRTTEAEYAKAEPAWETMLDLDELNAREKATWVWKGASFLEPAAERCMVRLSRGGGDAIVAREFDVNRRSFVDGGFALPESKLDVDWHSSDALYVATDFGPGSMTSSGYPRLVKEWKRGTPLAAAVTVFEVPPTDVGAGVMVVEGWGRRVEILTRAITRYAIEYHLLEGGRKVRIDVPRDALIDMFRDRLLIHLRSDWNVGGVRYGQGALLSAPMREFLAGTRKLDVLFEPSARVSLSGFTTLKDVLLLRLLDNVRTRIVELRHAGDAWQRRNVELDPLTTWSVAAVEPVRGGNDYFAIASGYLTPPSAYRMSAGSDQRTLLKSQPERFDVRGLTVRQHEAVSKDGTRVPYFLVGRSDMPLDGSTPTILYGYGGYEISQLPYYSTTFGIGWLERGGAVVVANLRGGGEFGPAWHQAALRENRQKSFDDFTSIAEDLIARRITSPKHLGIMGGSHGGLLVGVAMIQRPELFNAVVCAAPLLDMKRYTKLLAGASWMSEYGDPDLAADWAHIGRYSPYQNVRADGKYPRVFFTTSTRDDRVHPAHARKMVARMLEQKHPLLYYENIEGGHALAADNDQTARIVAMEMAFFWKQLR